MTNDRIESRVITGILHTRTDDGPWQPLSAEALTDLVLTYRAMVRTLEEREAEQRRQQRYDAQRTIGRPLQLAGPRR